MTGEIKFITSTITLVLCVLHLILVDVKVIKTGNTSIYLDKLSLNLRCIIVLGSLISEMYILAAVWSIGLVIIWLLNRRK